MKIEQLWRVVVILVGTVQAQYANQLNQALLSTGSQGSSGRGRDGGKEQIPPWGTVTTDAEREPTCAELRAMWRHTRRIIRHAANDANLQQLPSFVNTVEYAFAPKFLQFWHATPPRQGPKASLPFGRVLLTKSKSKRPPPPNSLSATSNEKLRPYEVMAARSEKTTRTPNSAGGNVALGGVGYFHEDDEGGELFFQDPAAEIDGMPREEEFGRYGTIVKSPEEKVKLRREFLLSNVNRLSKGSYDPYRYKSKFEICREKVENAPCRNNMECFCSKSVHPYTCHETLGVCTRKGGMQVLRDTYGQWFQRPFAAQELGFGVYNDRNVFNAI